MVPYAMALAEGPVVDPEHPRAGARAAQRGTLDARGAACPGSPAARQPPAEAGPGLPAEGEGHPARRAATRRSVRCACGATTAGEPLREGLPRTARILTAEPAHPEPQPHRVEAHGQVVGPPLVGAVDPARRAAGLRAGAPPEGRPGDDDHLSPRRRRRVEHLLNHTAGQGEQEPRATSGDRPSTSPPSSPPLAGHATADGGPASATVPQHESCARAPCTWTTHTTW